MPGLLCSSRATGAAYTLSSLFVEHFRCSFVGITHTHILGDLQYRVDPGSDCPEHVSMRLHSSAVERQLASAMALGHTALTSLAVLLTLQVQSTVVIPVNCMRQRGDQSTCPDTLQIHACMYCLLYTSPSPRDRQKSRMPSSA